jgi:hypothetical protein
VGFSPQPSRRALRLAVALTLVAAAVGCHGKLEPVARVKVEPATVALTYPGTAHLTATFEATAPLDTSGAPPVVFVHLLDAAGKLERTFDHPLAAPWQAGASTSDPIELWQSALAPPLPTGSYQISFGLYDLAHQRRWPLTVDGVEVDDDEYIVATVEVPPARASGPEVAFADGWLPVEPTGDRQTFAQRWLTGRGRLELSRLAGPLAVHLRLGTPVATESLRLVPDEGIEHAELAVSSDCSDETLRIDPAASRDVELTLRPPPPAVPSTWSPTTSSSTSRPSPGGSPSSIS